MDATDGGGAAAVRREAVGALLTRHCSEIRRMARSRYGRLLVSRYTSSLEWEALYQEGCAAVVRWPRRVPLDDRGFLAFMSVAVRNEFRQAYAQAARRAARATMEPYFEGTDRPSDGSGPRPEEEE